MPNKTNHGQAVASLVLGIIGTVCSGVPIVSIVLGLIGIILAVSAKKAGNTEGIRMAGFILSIISLVLGAIVFVVALVILMNMDSIIDFYSMMGLMDPLY